MSTALGDVIAKLKANQARLMSYVPNQARPSYAKLDAEKNRAVFLVGPRGVGKTTYLLQRASKMSALYLSADNPLLLSIPLSELVEAAFMEGYEGVLLDEVHYAKDWAQHLKAIYDSFPDRRIWASDSSAIALRRGLSDLSRRFLVRRLPLLSLREFMMLNGVDEDLPILNPFELDMTQVGRILKTTPVLRLFREWLQHGFRPFFLEGVNAYPEKLLGSIEKTMALDIPFLVPQLTEKHLRFMSAVIGYLAKSSVPTLAVNSLCNEWGIGKEKLYSLLNAMEEAQIIRVVRKKNDHKVHSIGAKIFLHDPSAYEALQGDLGSVREALTVAAFQEAGARVHASKEERDYDFLVNDKQTIEVGGRSKKRKNADFIVRDHIDFPAENVIPLWTLGFLY